MRPDPEWLHVIQPINQAAVVILRRQLDPGESEAIVLAAEISADLILIDEKKGRGIALGRGLRVTGLPGVLAEAKAPKIVPRCGPLLDDLIRAAGFWIGDELRARYLRNLNEQAPTPASNST